MSVQGTGLLPLMMEVKQFYKGPMSSVKELAIVSGKYLLVVTVDQFKEMLGLTGTGGTSLEERVTDLEARVTALETP